MLTASLIFLICIHVFVYLLSHFFEDKTKGYGWRLNYVLISLAIGFLCSIFALNWNSVQVNRENEAVQVEKYDQLVKKNEALIQEIMSIKQSKPRTIIMPADKTYRGVVKLHLYFQSGREIIEPIDSDMLVVRIYKPEN